MTKLDELKAAEAAATKGPWVLGWWSAQAELHCKCVTKGPLLGKRPQKQYPGAGPFHVHESDFYADEHRLSGPAPACEEVAGNYDYESGGIISPTDARYIALARNTMSRLLSVVEAARELAAEHEWSPYFSEPCRCEPHVALRAALAALEGGK